MKWPQPWVTALVFNREGKILLKRVDGQWRLPGGKLPGGLDWLASLAAELESDTGLQAQAPRLMGMYAQGQDTRVTAGFLVTEYLGSLREGQGVEALQWVAPQELPEPIFPGDRQLVADALQYRGEVFLR